MAVYSDAEVLYRCIGQLFDWAFGAEDLGNNLRASGVAIRLHLTDPVATISLDFGNGVVEFGDGSSVVPRVDLYMTADTAHEFWRGEVNVPLAVAKGTIRAEGSMATVLMSAPLIAPLSGKYQEILREAGLQEASFGR